MAMYLKNSRGKCSNITTPIHQNEATSSALWMGARIESLRLTVSHAAKRNIGTTKAILLAATRKRCRASAVRHSSPFARLTRSLSTWRRDSASSARTRALLSSSCS